MCSDGVMGILGVWRGRIGLWCLWDVGKRGRGWVGPGMMWWGWVVPATQTLMMMTTTVFVVVVGMVMGMRVATTMQVLLLLALTLRPTTTHSSSAFAHPPTMPAWVVQVVQVV